MMPSSIRQLAVLPAALAALALCALPLPALAQAPAPAAPVFGESIEVNLVNVEVVVVDKDGRPVVGLTRDDFELVEEDRPVAIEFFAGPEPGALYVPITGVPNAPVPQSADGESSPAPVLRPTLVVYVDGLDLRPGPRNDALKRIARLVDDRMIIGYRVLVAAFDQSLRLLTPMTEDRKLVRRALDELANRNLAGAFVQTRRRILLSEIQGISAIDQMGAFQAQSLLRGIESFAMEDAQQRRAAMIALSDLLSTLGGVDGPKAVFHLSAGLSTQPADDLYIAWERHFGTALGSEPDRRRAAGNVDAQVLQKELVRLTRAAQASRAVIYTIDGSDRLPEGLGAEEQGETAAAGQDPGVGAAAEASANLTSLAERSGGRRLLAGPGLDGALGDVASELASIYSLGFTPRGAADDRLHPLTVKVRREGVKVRHREGYRQRSTEDQLADSAVAAASLGAAQNPLAARLDVALGGTAKGSSRVVKALAKIPLSQLTLLPGAGVQSGKLVLEFALRDESGRVSRYERREQAFSIPDASIAGAASRPVAYGIEMHLAPGNYRLAVALLDAVGGNRTTTTVDFTVPGKR